MFITKIKLANLITYIGVMSAVMAKADKCAENADAKGIGNSTTLSSDAVTAADLSIDAEQKVIQLDLEVDESICTMYEYFEIFLGRMMMCRGAAEMLGAKFKLRANGSKIL